MKILSLIMIALLFITQGFSADNMAQKIQKQNSQVVALAAKELSKTLPQKIDNYTKLIAIKGIAQTLHYTFEINSTKSDEMIRKEDRTRMQKAVTQGICNSSKKFLESGIDISYIYTSAKSHKELFRFDVNQKVCH
jgi:hypothetical protein